MIRRTCPALKSGSDSCEGCKYSGRKAYDCAQLTRYAAKAAGLTLPSGASSQWNKGDWAAQGEIDTLPTAQVCFVFISRKDASPMGHTGIYMGDGTVVDARGHGTGVVRQALAEKDWTHWALLPGMDNSAATLPTLRQGSTGASVTYAQTLLAGLGYDLGTTGTDGQYGPRTATAVRRFQHNNGLTPDGIIGQATWKLLEKLTEPNALLPETTDEEKLAILWAWYMQQAQNTIA